MKRCAVLVLITACAHNTRLPDAQPPPSSAQESAQQLAAYTLASLVRDNGIGGKVLRELAEAKYAFAQNDPWGTPYRLEGQHRRYLQVRSFGPDRTIHTADDIVARIDFP